MPRQITFHEKPVKDPALKSNTGEGREWGRSQAKSYRWLIGSGIGVATLCVTGLLLLPLINKANSTGNILDQTTMILDPEEEEHIEGMDALNDMLTRQPEAVRNFQNFARADSAVDFLSAVRDAESLAPIIRKKPRAALVPSDWQVPQDSTWNIIESGGIPCGILEGNLPDFSVFSACFILDGNRMLLDWKATTGYGTATFSELAKGSGDGAEIRGWIQPANFYTATFPEADFQSYQLLSPDKKDALWCYTRIDNGPEHQTLARIFRVGEIVQSSCESQKFTIRLENRHPEALPNQRLIGKLLHKEWISP